MKKSKWGLDVFSLDWELFVIYKNGLFFFSLLKIIRIWRSQNQARLTLL